jgi:hypothetical protein
MEDNYINQRKPVLVDIPHRTIPTTSSHSKTVKIVKPVINYCYNLINILYHFLIFGGFSAWNDFEFSTFFRVIKF